MLRPALLLSLLSLVTGPLVEARPMPSTLEPATTGGLEALDHALTRLSTHRRLLMIAAHPDDEDSRTLAYVARSLGGEAVYLSLSRGEGGQNLIGDELGEGLGVLRSGELEAARSIDGAHQRFSRAYDFGYTRSMAEAFERWPIEALLEDAMRVARQVRPQVVVAIFPPTPRAGHGQHQASGAIASEVFERSQVPDAFPALDEEGLPAWSIASFWRTTWWDPGATTLKLPLGAIEPFSGRSIYQVALEARSQHRCQDMGLILPIGDADASLGWVAGVGGPDAEDLFAGVDTRVEAIAADLADPALRASIAARLRRVEERARGARAGLGAGSPWVAARPLLEILDLLRNAEEDLARAAASVPASDPAVAHALALVTEKRKIAEEAVPWALGLAVDATTDREIWTPGTEGRVRLAWWSAGPGGAELESSRLEGWEDLGEVEGPPPPQGLFVFTAEPTGEIWRGVRVAETSRPTIPWYLESARVGDLYDWAGASPQVRHRPFASPPLEALLEFRVGGRTVVVRREVVYQERDQARGEIRRPVRVVPEIELSVDTPLRVLTEASSRSVRVSLRSHAAGEKSLHVGWADEGQRVEGGVDLVIGPQERGEVELTLPDLPAGRHQLRVAAVDEGGRSFDAAYPLVDYEHVRPRPRVEPAEVTTVVGDLILPRLERVGFVVGASERVPAELEEAGLPIERLDAAALLGADLSSFDVIVVGSRAYETRPELAQANERLLEWVRRGGTLLVNYQQYQFVAGGYAPFAFDISRPHDRITDEGSTLRVLEPEHPVFHHPHEIGREDWLGWVQERGLYFAGSWGDELTPLVAMTDPGQDEARGGLLVAPLGEGTWIYTGISFFRQLPAGAPGPWRLFLNLLALGEPAETE